MTTAALAYSSSQSKKALFFLGISIIGALSIFYVFEMNSLINGAYLIKNYQKQLDNVLTENKNLEVDFAKTGFMGTVKEKTQQLSFEKVKEVKYIQIQSLDTSLAEAR